MPDKVVATHEQEQTLDALARRLEPQIYQEWKSELERRRLAALNSDLGMFGRMEAAAHLTDLLHGTQLSETAKQDRHFADLQSRLHIAVREIIASPNVTTRGIRPDGALVEVPRNIATQLKLDLENNILSTADGGVVWRAVVVRIPAPSLEVASEQSRPATPVPASVVDAFLRVEIFRRGKSREPKDRDTMVQVLRRQFPFVGARKARELFTNLPKALKERPGPKVRGHNAKARSGTTVPE